MHYLLNMHVEVSGNYKAIIVHPTICLHLIPTIPPIANTCFDLLLRCLLHGSAIGLKNTLPNNRDAQPIGREPLPLLYYTTDHYFPLLFERTCGAGH
jgi:hypothetical protein